MLYYSQNKTKVGLKASASSRSGCEVVGQNKTKVGLKAVFRSVMEDIEQSE